MPTGKRPRRGTVEREPFKRLQAMKMLELKIMQNQTDVQIAEQFNCSPRTVQKVLSWAARADIFASYEDRLMQELLPLSFEAVKQSLQEGNAKIAIEILKGIRLLKTGSGPQGSVERTQEDDLAAYIAQKRDRQQLQEATIEGHLVELEQRALAALPATIEEGSHDETAESGSTEGPFLTSHWPEDGPFARTTAAQSEVDGTIRASAEEPEQGAQTGTGKGVRQE